MVITQQRHHVFQAWQDLFVTNVALDPITATVLGPVLQCLLLMNGLPTLIPKTKPKTKQKPNPINSTTQTSIHKLYPNTLTLKSSIQTVTCDRNQTPTRDRPTNQTWLKTNELFLAKKTTRNIEIWYFHDQTGPKLDLNRTDWTLTEWKSVYKTKLLKCINKLNSHLSNIIDCRSLK